MARLWSYQSVADETRAWGGFRLLTVRGGEVDRVCSYSPIDAFTREIVRSSLPPPSFTGAATQRVLKLSALGPMRSFGYTVAKTAAQPPE